MMHFTHCMALDSCQVNYQVNLVAMCEVISYVLY